MRTINKIEDPHFIGIEVSVDGTTILQDAFPSRPAFVMNAMTQIPDMLKKFNQPELTADETAQIQSWVTEIDSTLLDYVDVRPVIN